MAMTFSSSALDHRLLPTEPRMQDRLRRKKAAARRTRLPTMRAVRASVNQREPGWKGEAAASATRAAGRAVDATPVVLTGGVTVTVEETMGGLAGELDSGVTVGRARAVVDEVAEENAPSGPRVRAAVTEATWDGRRALPERVVRLEAGVVCAPIRGDVGVKSATVTMTDDRLDVADQEARQSMRLPGTRSRGGTHKSVPRVDRVGATATAGAVVLMAARTLDARGGGRAEPVVLGAG